MTSLLDSTAHFTNRCARLGLTAGFVAALGAAGVDSLSRLAFILSLLSLSQLPVTAP